MVQVCVDPRVVTLEVRNTRATRASALTTSRSGPGSGLLGMTERATVLGGTLHAEPEGDGFVVRATLPLQAQHSPAAGVEARR